MIFMDFYKSYIAIDPAEIFIEEEIRRPLASIYARVNGSSEPELMFSGDTEDVYKMYKSMCRAIKDGKNYFEFSLDHLREV